MKHLRNDGISCVGRESDGAIQKHAPVECKPLGKRRLSQMLGCLILNNGFVNDVPSNESASHAGEDGRLIVTEWRSIHRGPDDETVTELFEALRC